MAGLNLYVVKADDYFLLETQRNPRKLILVSPNASDLYRELWKLQSEHGVNSIETGEMCDLDIECIKGALSKIKFDDSPDLAYDVQKYLGMVSCLSGELYSNPGGRSALLKGFLYSIREPISVRREEGYIIVDSLDGQEKFECIGDAVISLKMHLWDSPKPSYEIYSELDDREDDILRGALRGLYAFRDKLLLNPLSNSV
jgi:hypothetical protein